MQSMRFFRISKAFDKVDHRVPTIPQAKIRMCRSLYDALEELEELIQVRNIHEFGSEVHESRYDDRTT